MRVGSRSADRTNPALFRGRRAPGEDVATQSLRGVRTVSCACGRIGYRTGRGGTATRARVLRALLQAHPGAPVGERTLTTTCPRGQTAATVSLKSPICNKSEIKKKRSLTFELKINYLISQVCFNILW